MPSQAWFYISTVLGIGTCTVILPALLETCLVTAARAGNIYFHWRRFLFHHIFSFGIQSVFPTVNLPHCPTELQRLEIYAYTNNSKLIFLHFPLTLVLTLPNRCRSRSKEHNSTGDLFCVPQIATCSATI